MHRPSRKRPEAVGSDDLEWCHDAVQDVSRTFAISIGVLDEPMSSNICIGYLLCRIADTIEDAHHIPPSDQVSLLRAYDRVLDPTDEMDAETFRLAVEPWIPTDPDRPADWQVVAETPRVMGVFEAQPSHVKRAIRPPARELVQGMALFVDRYAEQGGLRIQTVSELEEYCYYAAGTVGELITNLVCTAETPRSRKRQLYRTAESFGLLLQLVNITKDVYDDFRSENNVYLPATWLHDEGLTQDDVCEDPHAAQSAVVVERMVDHARTFLDDAQAYLEHVPQSNGNSLAAWAIPYLLAVGTLRELSSRPEDALSERGVKISRNEVAAVVSRVIGESDHEVIDEMRRTIATRPYHTS